MLFCHDYIGLCLRGKGRSECAKCVQGMARPIADHDAAAPCTGPGVHRRAKKQTQGYRRSWLFRSGVMYSADQLAGGKTVVERATDNHRSWGGFGMKRLIGAAAALA